MSLPVVYIKPLLEKRHHGGCSKEFFKALAEPPHQLTALHSFDKRFVTASADSQTNWPG
jgi:hypothetical protein